MDILSKKQNKKTKLWWWIITIFILLTLISGGFLLYEWWDRWQRVEKIQAKLQTQSKELQELKDQVKQQYQLQEKQLISLTSWENNPKIHSFFTDLLTTYAKKFAEKKEIDISRLPLIFDGFYSDNKGEMGRCSPRKIIYPYEGKEINISLNRLYLLNKFGVDKYFATNPKQSGDYAYIDINFTKMLETCSHELAHYIQLAKHGKSSCESDLKLDNGKYDLELAKEHEEWTKKIYQIIVNSEENPKLEKKWQAIK